MQVYENNRSQELRKRRRKGMMRRRRRKKILCLVIVLLAVLTVRHWPKAGGEREMIGGEEIQNEKRNGLQVRAETKKTDAEKLLQKYESLLVLVNKEHALSQDYEPVLRSICKGRLEAADVLYDDLVEMLADAREAGYQFYIASAYRSAEYQQKLIDQDMKKRMKQGDFYENALAQIHRQVMPAGHSEHETGLALDILASGNSNLDVTQEACQENQWLLAHCMEYGFILRYPRGKEEITGIDYEPWHLRYVGREAAQYLTKKDLTLEEFWETF